MTTKKTKKPVKKVVAKKPLPKKPVSKKPIAKKKPVSKKKTNKKVFMLDGETVSDYEMKFYQSKIAKMYEDAGPSTNVPSPGEIPPEQVVAAELNILGSNYDKVILNVNTAPTKQEDTVSSQPKVTECVTPKSDYGVLIDVAVKFGCSIDSFNKLMSFMIQNKILSVGSIIEYNQNIRKFIRSQLLQSRIDTLEKELDKFVKNDTVECQTRCEEIRKEISNLKDRKEYDGAFAVDYPNPNI